MADNPARRASNHRWCERYVLRIRRCRLARPHPYDSPSARRALLRHRCVGIDILNGAHRLQPGAPAPLHGSPFIRRNGFAGPKHDFGAPDRETIKAQPREGSLPLKLNFNLPLRLSELATRGLRLRTRDRPGSTKANNEADRRSAGLRLRDFGQALRLRLRARLRF